MTRESKLQAEIKQNRPFKTPRQEASLALLRTASLLRRYYAKKIESSGVTIQQYNVLRILRGAGEQGLPALAVAGRMIEEAPGITRILDRLETRKWISRTRSEKDRRQVICRLNASGAEILAGLDPIVDGADEQNLAMLPDEEVGVLIGILEKIRDHQ